VRCAMGFESSIQVAAGEREADAKSLLAVLALGAKGGSDLRLRADGDDAAAALEALAGCVTGLV
jgi:phosphotransferase system HPr (HPr) family protein